MSWLFVVLLFVAVMAAELLRHSTAPRRRAQAHAYARRIDLRLEEGMTDVVAARLARRRCAGVVTGALLGSVTAVLLDGLRPDRTAWSATWLAFLAFFLGLALGSAAVAWYESSRPLPAGPRVARATVPEHGDYVPRLERWGAWGMAGVSALVAAGLAAVDGTGLVELGDLPGALVAAAVVAPLVAVVADELAARWLLRRRQVAATTLQLAWDDALRSRTLRDSVTVALVTALYAPLALLGVVGDRQEGGWPANPGVGLVSGIVLVLVLVALVMTVTSLVSRPEGHFRRRLWSGGPRVTVGGPVGGPGAEGVATGGAR